MNRVISEAIHAYAVAYLRDEGGTAIEAIRRADVAFAEALAKQRSSNWVNEGTGRRLKLDIDRIQDAVTERICTGERLWIKCGPAARWHRVDTPTRASCGAAINRDHKAWALAVEPEGERCRRCAA